MIRADRSYWESLERWSPWLYLVAGSILAVYAALNGVIAFTDTSVDPKLFEAGYVAGFLGLLGLYPTVAERSPRLAGVGAITAFLGLVAFSVFTVTNLAELLGLASGDPPGWTAFTVMAASGFIVGYLAVGIVVLRSGVYSRTVGLLLVLPGVIIILMFATIALEIASPASVFVVSAGQAMTHLAIGSTLRAETESTGQEEAEQTPETTVRG